MDGDVIALLDMACELRLHVWRRMDENRHAIAVHDEAITLAVRIEDETLYCAAHLRQAVRIDPMHDFFLYLLDCRRSCLRQPCGGGGGGARRSGPPSGLDPGPRGGRGPATSLNRSGEVPMALSSTILPKAVSSRSPRTETVCPGRSQSARRSASGGGRRSSVPSSRNAPFTSPLLPCKSAPIRPLMVYSVARRPGPFGGPLSTTLLPLAVLVTDLASTGQSRASAGRGWRPLPRDE